MNRVCVATRIWVVTVGGIVTGPLGYHATYPNDNCTSRTPLVLASASPRRRELLAKLGLPFEVVVSGVDETAGLPADPAVLVRELALRKGRAVSALVGEGSGLVLAADTEVTIDGQTLGKPVDPGHARQMLKRLRGRLHEVHTGIAVIDPETGQEECAVVRTLVAIRDLGDREIDAYVQTGAPFDKAGGYGAQDEAGLLVDRIEGCYASVIGLPLCAVGRLLDRFGLEVGRDPGWCAPPAGMSGTTCPG